VEDRNLTAYARVIQSAHRLATADRKSREAAGILEAARSDAVAAVEDLVPLLGDEERGRLAALLFPGKGVVFE
jgi:hypothetical protein